MMLELEEVKIKVDPYDMFTPEIWFRAKHAHHVVFVQHLTSGSKSFQPEDLGAFLVLAAAHGWSVDVQKLPTPP